MPSRASGMRWSFLPEYFDSDILKQRYPGSGTPEHPHVVSFLENDHQDAMNFSPQRKRAIAILSTICTFVATFASSEYRGGVDSIEKQFGVSGEVATLGLSLFVLGFALGPLVWAPLSEMYGRWPIFIISFTGFTAFNVAAIFSPNIESLLVLRFFAGASGASTLTNTGGVIADMFAKEDRGIATGLFVTAPFLGPALGPIVGGFLGESQSWRWILGLIAIISGVVWIPASLVVRETYAPVILRARAAHLCKSTGKVYVSRLDVGKPPKTLARELSIALSRPWTLLLREPIVFLMSLYMAIVYGTLYMFFAAVPIVFQGTRGWSQGRAGLPFVAVAIGVCLATVTAGLDNRRYVRLCRAKADTGSDIEPEARLNTAMLGAIALPIGLFLFAWTTYPSIHWMAPIVGALLFALGLVLVFVSQISYLIDSYTIYAASVLAGGSVLRSLFGAAFPLFTAQMYSSLGDQWASSVPAFLALGCLPIPFLFYKYGPAIRTKCKYASEAARTLEFLRSRQDGFSDVHKKDQEETT